MAEAARNIICQAEGLCGHRRTQFRQPLQPGSLLADRAFSRRHQRGLQSADTPVIGGNVSLSNETDGEAIYPTPIIGMAGLVEDVSLITTKDFKQAGDLIYLVGRTKAEFGGSELQKMLCGEVSGRPPELDLDLEKRLQEQVSAAIRAGLVQSAADLSEGGLAAALAECLASGELGASLVLGEDLVTELFSESQSRFLLSVAPEQRSLFEGIVEARLLGQVTEEPILAISSPGILLEISVEQLNQAWKEHCHAC